MYRHLRCAVYDVLCSCRRVSDILQSLERDLFFSPRRRAIVQCLHYYCMRLDTIVAGDPAREMQCPERFHSEVFKVVRVMVVRGTF